MRWGRAADVPVLALLVAGTAVMLFPLWWMVVVSLAPPSAALTATADPGQFTWWPDDPQWRNYPAALQRLGLGASQDPWQGFLDALANTVVITVAVIAGQIASCSLVGYGLACLRFRGRRTAFRILLATMMLPAQATMIPVFLLFRWLGWIDTLLPLIVPSFFGTAYFVFMFRQFFAQVPSSLLEAARILGARELAIWWRIMLPACRPVIVLTAVFSFSATWNDFLLPLIYLHQGEKMTLAVALSSFKNQYGNVNDVHLLMAAAVVTLIPCIVFFFVALRSFGDRLSLPTIKG